MSELPTGTVTFLFTDIQGSTHLWQQQPQAMSVAHARHDQILRTAFEGNHGYVFQVIGDAFCAAFGNAGDAVRAALQCQLELGARNWGEAPIHVRMGIHTGQAEIQENGLYHGYLTLSRVARLMAAGHGGQILISTSTQILAADELPTGAGLHDLGELRLKDMPRPEHIFQLTGPGLAADFPPLKTLETFQTNLPRALTSFIGRDLEIETIKGLVAANRLITLTGPGGCGKTRLSLETAADLLGQFPDGVWLVELAPLTDPTMLPQTLANALGIPTQSQAAITTLLLASLRSKQALLIFDNCEHMVEASARLIETLLQGCPQLRVMASSREALGLASEIPFRVPSLRLPEVDEPLQPEVVAGYEAVRLFVERAQAALPGFAVTPANAAAVANVCRRLDGIPLALELAAARVKMLQVEQIAARLDDRFRLLTGGSRTALPRQQTLRALVDWSYDLLAAPERVVLQRLSVFLGSWTLEAAEAVCSDPQSTPAAGVARSDVLELLAQLANKSLVVVERQPGAETRYRLLETIRQYARDRLLEAQDSQPTRDRHLEFFVAWVQHITARHRHTAPEIWVSQLELELDNFRAALEWALSAQVDMGVQLLASLGDFWVARGFLDEGLIWCRRFLTAPESLSPTRYKVRALSLAGEFALIKDSLAEARAWCQASVSLAQAINDPAGIALAYITLGRMAGDNARGAADPMRWIDEALAIARAIEDHPLIAEVLAVQGNMAFNVGNPAQARQCFEESLAIARKAGLLSRLHRPLAGLGRLAFADLDLASARQHFEAALVILRKQGVKFRLLATLSGLVEAVVRQGDYAAALSYLNEAKAIGRNIAEDYWLHNYGYAEARYLMSARNDYAGAVEICRKIYQHVVTEYPKEAGSAWIKINIMEELVWWAAGSGLSAKALRLAGAWEAHAKQAGFMIYPITWIELDRDIAIAREGLDEATVNSALADGRAMTLEQAIEYALA